MKNNQTVSLAGRVVLITGANTGIGLITARELAAQGAHVFIACRSRERGQEAINEIRSSTPNVNIELLVLDLGDLDSVRTCAATFLARDLPLHILINNAGLAGARGLSKSGFEMAFGVNHVGHFLFTQLLLDRIKQSAPARIVTVSSRAHTRVSGIDWNAVTKPTQTTTGFQEYGVSKLANLLFSAELGRKLAGTGVTTYALHPGVVASDVWRKVPWPFRSLMKLTMITVEEGAKTTIHCATSSDVANETGLYYDKCRVKEPTAVGQDAALAAELWRHSEAWVRA
jgi:retinol dehydrogenase 12